MNAKALSVVVGRFQVPRLHPGHTYLLDNAAAAGQLLVVLGSSGGLPDARNPLPYSVRRSMILGAYSDGIVAELFDLALDTDWSNTLDDLVAEHAQGRPAVLYASRDSFVGVYTGRYPVILLPPLAQHNGSALRDAVEHENSDEFRAGLIAAQKARLPISYQTVDVGVVRHDTQELLLGHRVKDGAMLRLIGGFVDPADQTLEAAASRELREEAGNVLTHGFRYLGSYRINDERYRGSADGILTALFATYLLGGMPRAGDDIDDLVWVPLASARDLVLPNHRPLVEQLVLFAQTGK